MSHDAPYALSDVDNNRAYLDAAYKRMKSAAKIVFHHDTWLVGHVLIEPDLCAVHYEGTDQEEASRAYFALCLKLFILESRPTISPIVSSSLDGRDNSAGAVAAIATPAALSPEVIQ